MKKCDQKRRLYFQRIAANRAKRKYRKTTKTKGSGQKKETFNKVIAAPNTFTIEDRKKRKVFLSFINKLKQLRSSHNQRVLLDFTKTEHMIADGTLLFKANLYRLIHRYKIKIQIKLSRSKKINQALQQTGVLKLLGQKLNLKISHPDVINWRHAQGAGAIGQKTDGILEPFDGAISETLQKGLYLGLTEAMTNTRQHAYPTPSRTDNFPGDMETEWWMFSEDKDGRAYVVFCDLGVGIPKSLPEKQPNLWKRIVEKFGATPNDSQVIKETILHSTSRTGYSHRGKGLQQLTNILSTTKGGNLRLHSNYGCYASHSGQPNSINYKTTINGTLICWSLPIKE
uniref:Histidine kinase-, DNA gyrase B-, and HSP90-like ATPase n=1 Tax=Candidatus Kentrum sp. TC TaxID=2126339 RepID=A0A450ZFS0_9GAMM|nr:MAG: hypothetical protein BECKTC1821D_GA0114238_11952 [Candidatus Kentron sp. TC]